MNIDKEEVRKIAHIARIAVEESELEQLAHQLTDILSYAQRVADVAAMVSQVGSQKNINIAREDTVVPSPVKAVLSVAPEVEEGYYVVPKILENTK